MRHEYCEKNGIIITYSDSDVAFEERETALAIMISNDGSILHNNFADDPKKTQSFLEDLQWISQVKMMLCYQKKQAKTDSWRSIMTAPV